MNDYTVGMDVTLPSGGVVYTDVNPNVRLRSMTTLEEMKRLNHSERVYKQMAEVIDDCIVEKIGISAYDLCIPDYQFLLHKLRIVTYGPEYKIESTCPYCRSKNRDTINLDDLPVITLDKEEYVKCSEITLPVTGKRIKLRMQTPRTLDDVVIKAKEAKRKNPSFVGEPAYLFTLESMIDTIDGNRPEEFRIIPFLQKLPMMDTNYIIRSAQKLNEMFGIETTVINTCGTCGLDYNCNFRTTSEFFGPTID